MTCLGCKYARLCIMYEPRMKACKDYKNDNSAKQTCPSNEGEHP